MSNENPNPDEQSWDVFRYVSGEMSAGEEQFFEQQLERDQSLREEVASMVSMMAKVNAGFSATTVTRPMDRSAGFRSANRRKVLRLVVSAAVLALFATLSVALMPKSEPLGSNAESVAITWAESIVGDEFELPELDDDFEFASFEFDGDDDWIADVVAASHDEAANLN